MLQLDTKENEALRCCNGQMQVYHRVRREAGGTCRFVKKSIQNFLRKNHKILCGGYSLSVSHNLFHRGG